MGRFLYISRLVNCSFSFGRQVIKTSNSESIGWLQYKRLSSNATYKSSEFQQINEDTKHVDHSDAQVYFQQRCDSIAELNDRGINPYPHNFQVSCSLQQFVHKYSHLQNGETIDLEQLRLAGRVMSVRESGSKLLFYDLMSNGLYLQAMLSAKHFANFNQFQEIRRLIKRGDLIGCVGFPGRTKKGELSIFLSNVTLLSPCLRILPSVYYGIKDREARHRKRYLDLLLNSDSMQKFSLRSKLIRCLRKFLDDLDFQEVETPLLNQVSGGASAKPFKTYHNELGQELFLRVAPELYLKQLLVGGIERVYEVGRQFRNEGIDTTHNPEFTMCEMYMAFADYEQLMPIMEKMLRALCEQLVSKTSFEYGKDLIVNLAPDFVRLDYMTELQKKLDQISDKFGQQKFRLPLAERLHEPESETELNIICQKLELNVTQPQTAARCLDKLVSKLVEPYLQQPTFLINHPTVLSPLAKAHRSRAGLCERFELYIAGKEIANGYTELNDPQLQRQRFMEQLAARNLGDQEAQQMDEAYCNAHEYGLPPAGGVGIGIDRFTMLLTNSQSIKEVLLFPAMRPNELIIY